MDKLDKRAISESVKPYSYASATFGGTPTSRRDDSRRDERYGAAAMRAASESQAVFYSSISCGEETVVSVSHSHVPLAFSPFSTFSYI